MLIVGVRLIPTHAGKTADREAVPARAAAHPHSRGENSGGEHIGFSEEGSSPLTRGKLAAQEGNNLQTGLIPTHAGKTRIATSVWSRSTAHPHSRGENREVPGRHRRPAGSSPLTRGKRAQSWGEEALRGLIPTHAGKTCGCSFWWPSPRAHPHSRGENGLGESLLDHLQGSSPLTRGKPVRPTWPWRSWGLIPTHAGKTIARALSIWVG